MRAGESVGARGSHEARPGNDGPGHWAGLFGADPHSALQLPGKQRASAGEHRLPVSCLTSSLPRGTYSLLCQFPVCAEVASLRQRSRLSVVRALSRTALDMARMSHWSTPVHCREGLARVTRSKEVRCCGWAEVAFSVQIHAGGSAVVSDLQGAAQAFLEWVGKGLDGEAL